MKDTWVSACCKLAESNGDHFWSGARKIIRNVTLDFPNVKPNLVMADCGFTRSKMTMLKRLYIHEESRAAAVELWRGRVARAKYGSVGFHCFNHTVKSDPEKRSKRASVMGPCIQSVSMTLLPDNTTAIDFFYRTTELYKKFPADLVFIANELLAPFDFSKAPVKSWRFHFANVTIHPMYFVTIVPHLDEPTDVLDALRRADRKMFEWTVKWTARYMCDEHHRGIAKFAQALRVKQDARTRIDRVTARELTKYLRDNHPGHRNTYKESDDEDDEE